MDEILKYHKYLNGQYLDERKLEECAKKLMGAYCIEKPDFFYQIAEIEFYFYSPNHRDIITYPRKCSEKLWFFHQSGVDLTIDCSNGFEGRNPCFGGILIRSLIKYDYAKKELGVICGPQKCVDELFDVLNAVDNSKELTPLLVKYHFNNIEVASTQRYISFNVSSKDLVEDKGEIGYQNAIRDLAKNKLKSILSANKKRESKTNGMNKGWLIASEEKNTPELFCDYLQAKYRYYLKDMQWEKEYKAANIDKNCYKYLLVTL